MTATWIQTNQHQWLSSDGRRVQYSPASQAFLVFSKGGYLGKETTLGVAQQRTDASPTRLQDVEGAIPAFLLLTQEERTTARGKIMSKAKDAAPTLTIEHVTREYNRLAADALAKGLNYKPVTSFETIELAQASLEQLASSLRANIASEKAVVNQNRTEAKKGVAKAEASGKSSPNEEGKTSTGPSGAPPTERSTMSTKKSTKVASKAKSAKKAPAAKKAAKAKAAPKGAARNNVADDAKCSVVGANPFREGTSRYTQLELVRKGTVAAFLKAGGDRAYLSWYVRNGHAKAG